MSCFLVASNSALFLFLHFFVYTHSIVHWVFPQFNPNSSTQNKDPNFFSNPRFNGCDVNHKNPLFEYQLIQPYNNNNNEQLM